MREVFSLALGFLVIVTTGFVTIGTAGAFQKKQPNAIMTVSASDYGFEDEDEDIKQAFQNARKTLDQFLKMAAHPEKGTGPYLVKIPVRNENGTSYKWISPFKKQKGSTGYEGVFYNQLKTGRFVQFRKAEIIDWGYTKNGLRYGFYETCARFVDLPKGLRERRRKHYACQPFPK